MAKRFSLSAFVLGAALALPVAAARADEPMTEQQAQQAAQDARDQADHYRQMGGVGYKAGLVQWADADAASYEAKAEKLAGTPAPETQTPNPSCQPTKPPVDALCDKH